MANNSIIKITFNTDATGGDFVQFSRKNLYALNVVLNREDFITGVRASNNVIGTINPVANFPGLATAIEFKRLFELDHNTSGVYIVTRTDNEVTIEAGEGWDIENFTSSFATAVISPAVISSFKVLSIYARASNQGACDYMGWDITTTEDVVKLTINDTIQTNGLGSFFTINIPRNVKINTLKIENAGGESINLIPYGEGVPSPMPIYTSTYWFARKLYGENVLVSVQPNPMAGATVEIGVEFPGQLSNNPRTRLEYSLDNINWRYNNVFTGIEEGEYTVYVKDAGNCTVTKDFVVDERGAGRAYFNLSKNNSITFSKDEVWDGYKVYKNDDNTLSESSLANKNYKADILYQDGDRITVQFKSSFDNHKVYKEICDEPDQEVLVTKMSNNMGRFEKLDCIVYPYSENMTGIYFDSGNRYDEYDNIIGDYELNGNLPDFAQIGNHINLPYPGNRIIKDIIYDPSVGKKVILIAFHTTQMHQSIVYSRYNLLNFEVYHFSITFSKLIPNLRLRIQCLDSFYDEENYYTDNINVRDVQEKTLAINYYGKDNRDIFYSYGITHFARIRYESVTAYIKDEVDSSLGDNSGQIDESTLHDGNTFVFDYLTRDEFLKVCIALSSEYLYINNVGYIKTENIEFENAPNTNLYKIKVNLIKNNLDIEGRRYLGWVTAAGGGQPAYVPRVLSGNTGLIKI